MGRRRFIFVSLGFCIVQVQLKLMAAELEPEQEMGMENWPFTMEEMETCIKVANALVANETLLFSTEMRTFRKAMAPLTHVMETRKYGGSTRSKYLEDKARRMEKKSEHLRKRHQDENYVKASALRMQRRQRLNQLLEANPSVCDFIFEMQSALASLTGALDATDCGWCSRSGG